MRRFLEIARTGLAALRLHRLRSLATLAAVLALLVPYLVGLGISRGIQDEAEVSVRCGADLYVTGLQFGQRVPVPLALRQELEQVPGVVAVVPRIVGAIMLGRNRENAVLLGLPVETWPETVHCIEGRLPRSGPVNEFVVGSDLARRLELRVGSRIPPFYRNVQGEHVSEVVGVFQSDVSLWQSRLVLASIETAAHVFDQQGLVSDFLVYCQPGYEGHAAAQILERLNFEKPAGNHVIRLKVIGREDLMVLLPSGLAHREGIFNLHFIFAFAVGILVVLVTSGFGLPERRREIGILKATGWQTDEVLLRSLVENSLLSVASASLAIVLSYAWLKWLNGFWIASIFLAGVEMAPGFDVPFRLTPIPVLLSVLIAFALILSGTLYSAWRAAIVPPIEAMR